MIDNMIHFAEEAYRESQKEIERYDKFNESISDRFEKQFGYKYDPTIRHLYRKEWKDWLNKEEKEFNKILDKEES